MEVFLDDKEYLEKLSRCQKQDWFQGLGYIDTIHMVSICRVIAAVAVGKICSWDDYKKDSDFYTAGMRKAYNAN